MFSLFPMLLPFGKSREGVAGCVWALEVRFAVGQRGAGGMGRRIQAVWTEWERDPRQYGPCQEGAVK